MSEALGRAAVAAALRAPLPGPAAQARMRPKSLPEPPSLPWKEAAVLVLLYPSGDGLAFPLLLRGEGLAHHGGQIGLPGGSRLFGEDLAATALRETEEEIGVSQDRIELLGALSPLWINRSGFELRPYVGWTSERPAFCLQAGEVAGLVEAELTTLLDPRSATEAHVETDGASRSVPAYRFSGRTVWGATAMILSELAALLAGDIP